MQCCDEGRAYCTEDSSSDWESRACVWAGVGQGFVAWCHCFAFVFRCAYTSRDYSKLTQRVIDITRRRKARNACMLFVVFWCAGVAVVVADQGRAGWWRSGGEAARVPTYRPNPPSPIRNAPISSTWETFLGLLSIRPGCLISRQ